MTSLEQVLADNGLGKWYAVLAAEDITLTNIGDHTNDELKELGVSSGARKDILKLFAKPQRPDAPASSKQASPNKHSGRTLQGGGDSAIMWTKHGSGKKFACFLSHHKASCAMEARFLKTELQGLIQKECFLDSDDLRVSGLAAAASIVCIHYRHRRICASFWTRCATATSW
jgi:hypothetical protein